MEKQPMPQLSLRGVNKSFDGTQVLRDLSLDVNAGEFLTLLGPSGCGKTTTLRIVAGLESPDVGQILLDGQDMGSLPPEKRPLNTVFQSYALFPHMNVAQNVGYGLKLRRIPKNVMKEKIASVLSLVQLEGFDKRMPGQLSGGQRQRVAIARALVLEPKLLLLDEPLGALDLQLRRQMQHELKKLQQTLGITFIYVTHDQEEALNMSDRIVVMNGGRICQLGTPEDVYERPTSIFAAQFIGQTNLLKAVVAARLPEDHVSLDMGGLTIPAFAHGEPPQLGTPIRLCVRMERVRFGETPQQGFHLSAIVREKQYAGGTQRTVLELPDGQTLTSLGPSHDGADIAVGHQVFVWWEPKNTAIVPEEAEA